MTLWILPALLLAAVGVLVLAGAITEVTGLGKRNGVHVQAYRWHSGGSLDGKLRTDATFTQPASKVLHPKGRVHRWHWVRGWRRSAVRIAAELLVLAAAVGLVEDPVLTGLLLLIAAAPLAAWGLLRAANWARTWRHRRHYVRPLERTLAAKTGIPPAAITVERDGDAVKSVAIEWAPEAELSGDHQQAVLTAVATRLALEAPVAAWKLRGRDRSVKLTHSEPPPFPVSWDDMAAVVEGLRGNELAFGLGKRGVPVKRTYSESPHLIIAGGSGGGKSNLAAFLLLQELHRGSLIFNLDPKWISHLWMQNLPNVINAHETRHLHLALEWLGCKELLRRTKAAYYSANGTGRIRANVGSRIIVVCEELNYGMEPLKNLWREIRSKGDPKRSPALAGLQAISCAGRAADMHEYLMAQMLTVESTGVKDSTIRGNAGHKAMVRWELPGWQAACGRHVPMPAPPTIPGRIQVVTAGAATETQVPYLHLDDDDEEVAERAVRWAREYAVSGTVAQIPSGPEGVPFELWPASVLPERLGITAGQGPETVSYGTPSLPPMIPLRRACAEGVLQCSLDAARKAAQRPGFPEVKGWDGSSALYSRAELQAFTDGKVRVLR
jgi:hypothetical protein